MIDLIPFDVSAMRNARNASLLSKDKTKIGACLTDRHHRIFVSYGCNHLPQTFSKEKEKEYLANRELKNRFIIHAEVDAISKTIIYPDVKYGLYVWGLHSCARCAGFVSNYPQIECVMSVDDSTTDNKDMWNEEAEISKKIYEDAGIKEYRFSEDEFQKQVEKNNLQMDFYW